MVLRTAAKLTVTPVAIFLLLAYSPGLLDINPVYVDVRPPRPFTGPLEPNTNLEKAEKLFRNHILGPESLAFYNGDLYTGLHNGWIVRIREDRIIEPITTFGDPSCETWEEERCGRPLGLRFGKNGTLFVADSYYGLYNIDVHTGTVNTIFHHSQMVDGKRPKITNDFDITLKGDIYFSDSSTKFPLSEGLYTILESAPNGRILHHNLQTNETHTLVDGVVFANGVQLSPKEDYLIFSETGRSRVMKYHLKGASKGKLEVFIDNLPGYPDNIRSNGHGGYWLALCVVNPPQSKSALKMLGPYGIVRKVLAQIVHLGRTILRFSDRFFPSSVTKTLIYKLAHMYPYVSMESPYGLILELNNKGEIVRSLHAPSGSITYISQVSQYGDALYLGSPWNHYLAKLTL